MKTKLLLALLFITLITVSCGAKPVTSEQVIASFKAKGLEAESVRPMDKKDYGAAPYVCAGTRFFTPSLGEKGGRLFICDNTADRDALADFYIKLGKGSAMLFSWVFVKGNVLVQINGDLPEATAKQYEAAIP